MLSRLRNFLVKWKYRISYFSGFLSTLAAIVILSNTMQDKLSMLTIYIPYGWIILIVLLGVLFGAYLLDKLGFIESEIDYSNSKNNLLKEIGGKNGSNNKSR